MSKLSVVPMVGVMFAALVACADGASAKTTKEQIREKAMVKFGGHIAKPGSKQGSVGFVNAQKRIPASEIDKVVAGLREMLNQEVSVRELPVKGMPTRSDVESAGFSVAVFAVDDPNLPGLLSAPEDRWALVNVAKLSEGLKDDVLAKGLTKHRFRGELHRAFALVAGGWASQYQGNMNNVSSVRDLDSLKVDAVTVDVMMRCDAYLKSIGVTPEYVTTYQRACREGWAPSPTNEFQKAVWDRVHAAPTKPIVIAPEKTKQK